VTSPSNSKAPSRALGFVFLPFLAAGLFFLVMVIREVAASAATYTWPAFRCRVVASEVRELADPQFPWQAYLRYSWDSGESERSSRSLASYSEALRAARRWPAGSSATCYADPRDPSGALLERKSLALALFVPLPLVFVLVGAVGLYSVVLRRQPGAGRAPRAVNPAAGHRIAAVLLIMGGAVGVAVFVLLPMHRVLAARGWRARECRILRSGVQPHEGEGDESGTSWSAAVLYAYTVDGVEHRSDTYGFLTVPGTRSSVARAAERYPRGTAATCYVNPANPDDAVLHRGPPLACLIGLAPFGLLLAAGVAVWRRARRRSLVGERLEPGATE
jgi:hypothetical protein